MKKIEMYEVLAYVRKANVSNNGTRLTFEDVPDTTQVLQTFDTCEEAETWIRGKIDS